MRNATAFFAASCDFGDTLHRLAITIAHRHRRRCRCREERKKKGIGATLSSEEVYGGHGAWWRRNLIKLIMEKMEPNEIHVMNG